MNSSNISETSSASLSLAMIKLYHGQMKLIIFISLLMLALPSFGSSAISVKVSLHNSEDYLVDFKLCEGEAAFDCGKELFSLALEPRSPSNGSYIFLNELTGLGDPYLHVSARPKYYPFQRSRWTKIGLKKVLNKSIVTADLFKEVNGLKIHLTLE